jgi:hypothetical protein
MLLPCTIHRSRTRQRSIRSHRAKSMQPLSHDGNSLARGGLLVDRALLGIGRKLEQKDQNFVVSSATILRDYLQKKGYKCLDEPL